MESNGTDLDPRPDSAPSGVSFHQDANGWQLAVNTRNLGGACLWAIICTVWTALTAGVWFVTQVQKGQFSWGSTIVGSVFFVIGLLMWTRVAMYLGGRTTLTVHGNEATLYSGVGSCGLTRRFKWTDINWIEIQHHKNDSDEPYAPHLVLVGNRTIRLSEAIYPDVHDYILGVVRAALAARNNAD